LASKVTGVLYHLVATPTDVQCSRPSAVITEKLRTETVIRVPFY